MVIVADLTDAELRIIGADAGRYLASCVHAGDNQRVRHEVVLRRFGFPEQIGCLLDQATRSPLRRDSSPVPDAAYSAISILASLTPDQAQTTIVNALAPAYFQAMRPSTD
jgi:hypothetical protein